MAFTSSLASSNGVAKITLVGELDAAATPAFKTDVEAAAAAQVTKLVLDLSELNYMSSAGLRALIFAKQKMGSSAEIIMVGVQESVRETLEMTGFQNSVTLVDSYEG